MTYDEAVRTLGVVARYVPEGTSWCASDGLLSVDYDVRSSADMEQLVEALADLPEAIAVVLGELQRWQAYGRAKWFELAHLHDRLAELDPDYRATRDAQQARQKNIEGDQ